MIIFAAFQHHMLVINVIDPCTKEVRVIHCANPGKIKAGQIVGLNNKVFKEGITITGIIERAMYKNDVSMVSVPEGISRARSRLSETDYNIFNNNCESFVNWAVTNRNVMDQGQRCQFL